MDVLKKQIADKMVSTFARIRANYKGVVLPGRCTFETYT